MFVFIYKQYPELFARKVCIFLKTYATFKRILLLFLYVCKKTFRIFKVHISKKVKDVIMRNLRGTFYMTTNVLLDFHTYISVPLINKTLTVSSAKIVNGLNSPNRFTALVFLSFIQFLVK